MTLEEQLVEPVAVALDYAEPFLPVIFGAVLARLTFVYARRFLLMLDGDDTDAWKDAHRPSERCPRTGLPHDWVEVESVVTGERLAKFCQVCGDEVYSQL